jgi:hypothetical protein
VVTRREPTKSLLEIQPSACKPALFGKGRSDCARIVGYLEGIHFNACPTSEAGRSALHAAWLAANLPLLSGRFQLAVAFGMDLFPADPPTYPSV